MRRGEHGFTVTELVVVLALVGVLTALSAPAVADFLRDAGYRRAARELAGALRWTRARAIRDNLEYKFVFDCDSGCYWLQLNGVKQRDLGAFPAGVRMAANQDCSNVGDGDASHPEGSLEFNPNGSSQSRYFCILDEQGIRRFRTGINYAATGRVTTQRWNVATNDWE